MWVPLTRSVSLFAERESRLKNLNAHVVVPSTSLNEVYAQVTAWGVTLATLLEVVLPSCLLRKAGVGAGVCIGGDSGENTAADTALKADSRNAERLFLSPKLGDVEGATRWKRVGQN